MTDRDPEADFAPGPQPLGVAPHILRKIVNGNRAVLGLPPQEPPDPGQALRRGRNDKEIYEVAAQLIHYGGEGDCGCVDPDQHEDALAAARDKAGQIIDAAYHVERLRIFSGFRRAIFGALDPEPRRVALDLLQALMPTLPDGAGDD